MLCSPDILSNVFLYWYRSAYGISNNRYLYKSRKKMTRMSKLVVANVIALQS